MNCEIDNWHDRPISVKPGEEFRRVHTNGVSENGSQPEPVVKPDQIKASRDLVNRLNQRDVLAGLGLVREGNHSTITGVAVEGGGRMAVTPVVIKECGPGETTTYTTQLRPTRHAFRQALRIR